MFSTISIVDRFLAVEGLTITRSKLQLVGVAAMFLASKVEEVYAPACSDFVYITDNAYTEDAIKQMEMKILQTLKFNLFEPLSLHFLRRFSKAGDVDVLQHSLAKFAIELALVEYDLVPVPGSKLAASALCLSLILLEPKVLPICIFCLIQISGEAMQHLGRNAGVLQWFSKGGIDAHRLPPGPEHSFFFSEVGSLFEFFPFATF